ncbi:MAG: helix-turn-helix transcriptional regulator [Oscillospiraceae bacterium]|nr:helix-turn-helix transcriptional regulator [Oscillospiraceae bacterium]
MTKIGDNIKKVRTKSGMTQEELAEKINVTRQAISNWENGKTEPDIETLTKIAQIFDISIDELVDGIPQNIAELRGKKIHLKLGILFVAFFLTMSLLVSIIKEPLNEYMSTNYDMIPYMAISFFIIPAYKILGAIGACFLITYSTGFYVKNKNLRFLFLFLGIPCIILTTVYLIYLIFVYRLGLSFIFPVDYYIFLLKHSYVHIIGPTLIFFGLMEK